MVNMTLAVDEDLHNIMKEHSEVKWSEVARKAMRAHAQKLQMMDTILAKSTLTQKDADEIAEKIKEGIAKRHGL
ncbi:MAG: hypothetical protein CMH61_00515 [Nanoarchaeota archaeon]|nr:hypothetical protein [Nanoarchaeota archaeon]